MERSINPNPINPNAKYLPDSISNVLNSIQKFDQGILAWPTGPRKKHLWAKKLCQIPLAGRTSSVISKSTSSKSRFCEQACKKHTFYQILHASQDQPGFEKSARNKRINKPNPRADIMYNNLYDIVRTYLQMKRHLQPDDFQGHRAGSETVASTLKEIYRVRPRVAETTIQQKGIKVNKWKSTFAETKLPIVKFFSPRNEPNELHKTVSKSKGQKSGVNKRSEHPIKKIGKAKKIYPKGSVKNSNEFHAVQSPRKQINKSQIRNTETRMQRGNTKEKTKVEESNLEGANGKSNKTKESKIQKGITEDEKSTIEGKPINKKESIIKGSNGKSKKAEESKLQKGITEDEKSIIEGKPNNKIETKVEESNLEGANGKSNKTKDSKIQKGITEDEKSIIEGKPNNKIETKVEESNIEGANGKSNKTMESKIQKGITEGETSIIEGKPNNKIETKVEESIIEGANGKSNKTIKSMIKRGITEGKTEGVIEGKPNNQIETKFGIRFEEATKGKSNKKKKKKIQEGITEGERSIIEGKPYNTVESKVEIRFIPGTTRKSYKTNESITEGEKVITEGKPRNTNESKIEKSIIEETNGNSNKSTESKIQESITDGETRIIEGKKEEESIIEGTPINATDLNKKMETTPESIKKNRVKSKNSYSYSRKSRSTIASLYEPPPISSECSSVTTEPVKPLIYPLYTRRSMERRASIRLSTTTYEEKLWKLKEYLNGNSLDNITIDTVFPDIEGILESDILNYPYDDIYRRYNDINNEDNNVVKKVNNKRRPKPSAKEIKPPETEKKCERDPIKKKSPCCVCQAVGCPEKDAPFLVKMREEQKRQELMAYRAQMAMSNRSSQRTNQARNLAICNMYKKLYSLEDKEISFIRPKRSDSSIFPSSSKTRRFPKKCHSFTFHKESSGIICS
ncbi:hypothetical protein KR032_012162 [Drosophila birchii]|nr:hypothetical protein KR032_012162 [Drosophila birchii]